VRSNLNCKTHPNRACRGDAALFPPGDRADLNRERNADGFGNIKWGITIAEAEAAFPGLREPERSELMNGAFEERLNRSARTARLSFSGGGSFGGTFARHDPLPVTL
jgi:hypothetical protein